MKGVLKPGGLSELICTRRLVKGPVIGPLVLENLREVLWPRKTSKISSGLRRLVNAFLVLEALIKVI